MPKANYLDRAVLVIYSIDDAVRSNNNLAKIFVTQFGHNSPTLRKLPQTQRLLNQEPRKPKRLVMIVGRDV